MAIKLFTWNVDLTDNSNSQVLQEENVHTHNHRVIAGLHPENATAICDKESGMVYPLFHLLITVNSQKSHLWAHVYEWGHARKNAFGWLYMSWMKFFTFPGWYQSFDRAGGFEFAGGWGKHHLILISEKMINTHQLHTPNLFELYIKVKKACKSL